MSNDSRNYGLDALKILLTLFICVLHTLKRGGILSSSTSVSFCIFWLIETFAFCAVDGYALISGYVSNCTKVNYKRIIHLWLIVFFYSFVITVVFSLFHIGPSLSLGSMVEHFFPILYCEFWYMTAYFPLFFFMPIINKTINSLNDKEAKYLFLSLIIIFSCFGTVQDNYLNGGYHFLWISILFVIGSLIKKLHLFEKIETSKMIIIYIICNIVSWLTKVITGSEDLISYISPTILLSAITLLIVFSRLKPNKHFVSFIVPLTTGVYLFQCNSIVWSLLDKRFVFVSEMNPLLGVFTVLILALVIFLSGGLVDFLRQKLYILLKIDSFSRVSSIRLIML